MGGIQDSKKKKKKQASLHTDNIISPEELRQTFEHHHEESSSCSNSNDSETSSSKLTFSARISTSPQHEYYNTNDESIGIEINLVTSSKKNNVKKNPKFICNNKYDRTPEKFLSDVKKEQFSNHVQSTSDVIRMAEEVLGSSVTTQDSKISSRIRQVTIGDSATKKNERNGVSRVHFNAIDNKRNAHFHKPTVETNINKIESNDFNNEDNKFSILAPTPSSDLKKKMNNDVSISDVLEHAERVLAKSRRATNHSTSFKNPDRTCDNHANLDGSKGKIACESCKYSPKNGTTSSQSKSIAGKDNNLISVSPSMKSKVLLPQSTDTTMIALTPTGNKLSSPLSNEEDDEYAFSSLPVRSLDIMESSSITKENRENILNMLDGFQKSPKRLQKKKIVANDDPLLSTRKEKELPPSFPPLNNNNSMTASHSMEDIESILSSPPQLSLSDSFRDKGEADSTNENENGKTLTKENNNSESFESKNGIENDIHSHFKIGKIEHWISQMTNNIITKPKDSGPKEDFNNCYESMYEAKASSSLIFHEINRGDWSWCSAWSPDGKYLAIGTENHGLAVLDTTKSLVWKVIHDSKLKSSNFRTNSTHAIRHIAWGNDFIAIGGIGNSVSIIEPFGSFPIVHTIKGTGYVGQLSWRNNSPVLAIASRDDQCLVVEIKSSPNSSGRLGTARFNRTVSSNLILSIETSDWVNAISFSPSGSFFSLGDRKGKVYIYSYLQKKVGVASIKLLKKMQFDNSILDLAWSHTEDILLIGGEDSKCTIISVPGWTILNRIRRDRWVQFVSPSVCGLHVVLGGGSSQISFHSKSEDYKVLKSIEAFDGSIISAEWHPKNQFLAITGQDNKAVILETTTVRNVPGKSFHSTYIITAMEISVDGKILIVGNTQGVVTFFDICQEGFATVYELVLAEGSVETIRCSPNGKYVAIGGDNNLVLIKSHFKDHQNNQVSSFKCRYSLLKIMRGLDSIQSISFSPCSSMLAISGLTTKVLDIESNKFDYIQELDNEDMLTTAWSPDGNLLALIGRSQHLVIYNTQGKTWEIIFTVQCEKAGLALAWGPTVNSDLQYLAYGGEEKIVKILEIRTNEITWETVLQIPRSSRINDLSWNELGLLAVAISDGNVIIVDLAYLKSGRAVNEMDYNWQRQGITCLIEIRNNDKNASMISVHWMPFTEESQYLLTLGSINGFEMIDLTPANTRQGS